MINRIHILGNIGNVNVKEKATIISVATNYKFKEVDETEWHNVVCFGKLAEIMSSIAEKGKKCYVEGRLKSREYEGKKYIDIIADVVKVI